jgi:hypothetical protein
MVFELRIASLGRFYNVYSLAVIVCVDSLLTINFVWGNVWR